MDGVQRLAINTAGFAGKDVGIQVGWLEVDVPTDTGLETKKMLSNSSLPGAVFGSGGT